MGHWTDHTLGHETNLNKFKRFEIIQTVFSNHGGIKLEVNNNITIWKFINMWNLNNTYLNKQWVKEEITGEIRTYFEMDSNKNTSY